MSSFRLDKYEITVGRFRKFVAAYSATMIVNGAGKKTNNPADTGWDAANWNASLATCNNCAVLASGTYRVIRGGGFLDAAAAQLVSARSNCGPSLHNNFFDIGARCARVSL